MSVIRSSCQTLMNIEFYGQIFEKQKFPKYLSRRSRVTPCGQTDRQWERQREKQTIGQTDVTKLILAF